MTTPLVSVLIPAYNAAATIRRAVDSVLSQSYRCYEIIVVDDASLDGTADIVEASYGDQVRLLRLSRNQGTSHATNEGIALANGDFIAFLDADDEWLPEKLARQVQVLQRHPDTAFVASGCRFVTDHDGLGRDDGIFSLDVSPTEVWRLLLARTLVAKPCVMVRATVLRAVGPFDANLPIGEDQDMWIRLAIAGGVQFVPEILTIVHDTAGSLTKVYADKIDRYMLPMIGRHLEEQRHRLSRREVRAILGERYAAVGRNLYNAGSLLRGATLLVRAMLLNHHVLANIWYLITASPPVKATKRLLGHAGGVGGSDWSRRSTA